ncbi:MAG TPA: beta-ketoacyl-[acyl-carrier-protein] synthase family protein [Burkholderiales bacterium]|nr:beta-ketoacyl-[acyl-carrier-protein] synthase family protein [Burkholderiales bacterium]
MTRIVVTGTGAICGAGKTPGEILEAARAGRSAFAPIGQWDASSWPVRFAAEVADFNPNALLNDRKLFKLIRRTDAFGIYAAGQAIEAAGLTSYRDGLDPESAARFNDATGIYVGSGGGAYQNQYDYFPLLAAADGSLPAFGRELGATVNPMWLLRSLPNNVLCHVGIRYGLKGPNACITNHSISGALAIIEAAQALRTGECERAVAAGHDAPIEPQAVLYYHGVGLLTEDALRPFDADRSGSAMGEGAAALVLETESAAAARGAAVLGEILGSGCASEGEGLLPIRDDGDGLTRAIALALDDSGLRAADVGMIVAHGTGTRSGDASEARALREVFGAAPPPVTAFKWAFGHLLAASGIIETVLALAALREGTVPGIAALRRLDPACAGLPVSPSAQSPRSDVALVLSRGFGGTNAALALRAA